MTPEEIQARRRDLSAHFLVTGATGFLGAHVTSALLRRGFRVSVLVRNGGGLLAIDRVKRILGWCGVERLQGTIKVLAGDVSQHRLGLPEGTWRLLLDSVDEVVHCAASTRFSEASRSELERTNVEGTAHALACAVEGRAHAFHLVSTAYVAGCVQGLVDEAWREPSSFTNAYEETKHRAEALARRVASDRGLSLSIYRPTIVYGHSETGRSLLFNALYYPIKTLLFLRDLLLGDLRRGGTRAERMGVELVDGKLVLPLRLQTEPGAMLNLVPVDHFVRAFMALLDGHPGGGIFHIATDEPIDLHRIVGFAGRRYGIQGLEVAFEQAFLEHPRTALERLFEEYVGVYRPYMRDMRRFDDTQARGTLDSAGVRCPRFTYETFNRIMNYAEAVEWGRKLFD